MSTRAKIASALASVGVLALGWQVGTANGLTLATTTPTTTTTGNNTTTGTTTTTGKTTTTTTTTTAASGLNSGTFTGTTATDRYGSVQVSITVANGKITAVNATANANDNRSQQINSQAIPVLKSETLSAQSVSISTVSGATYTSTAYVTSLQSALDKAAA